MARVLRRSLLLLSAACGALPLAGCGDDATKPPAGVARAAVGVQVNRRGGDGADPLLVEAYGDVRGAALDLAQCSVDWGEIEPEIGFRAWEPFDAHVRRAVAEGIPLSVQLLVIDNQARGERPRPLDEIWLEDPWLRARLARFAQEIVTRGRGTVRYLWIGREVDAYLAENRAEVADFARALEACRDSVALVDPSVSIGTSLAWSEGTARGRQALLDAIADAVLQVTPLLGLTVQPTDDRFAEPKAPSQTVSELAAAVDHFAGHRLVVTEVAHLSLDGDQGPKDEFVRRLLEYAGEAPERLEALLWSPLHDFAPGDAATRADRLFDGEVDREQNYARVLRTSGLKQVNSAPTQAWLTLREWSRSREGARVLSGPGG